MFRLPLSESFLFLNKWCIHVHAYALETPVYWYILLQARDILKLSNINLFIKFNIITYKTHVILHNIFTELLPQFHKTKQTYPAFEPETLF